MFAIGALVARRWHLVRVIVGDDAERGDQVMLTDGLCATSRLHMLDADEAITSGTLHLHQECRY